MNDELIGVSVAGENFNEVGGDIGITDTNLFDSTTQDNSIRQAVQDHGGISTFNRFASRDFYLAGWVAARSRAEFEIVLGRIERAAAFGSVEIRLAYPINDRTIRARLKKIEYKRGSLPAFATFRMMFEAPVPFKFGGFVDTDTVNLTNQQLLDGYPFYSPNPAKEMGTAPIEPRISFNVQPKPLPGVLATVARIGIQNPTTNATAFIDLPVRDRVERLIIDCDSKTASRNVINNLRVDGIFPAWNPRLNAHVRIFDAATFDRAGHIFDLSGSLRVSFTHRYI